MMQFSTRLEQEVGIIREKGKIKVTAKKKTKKLTLYFTKLALRMDCVAILFWLFLISFAFYFFQKITTYTS